jgi:alpha-methylacyl-CoA racemase
MDSSTWPALKEHFARVFRTRTRDEWCQILEGSDACFAPVLDMDEVATHPHNAARQAFVEVDGLTQPAPVPRFSETPGGIHRPPPKPGQHTNEVLAEWAGLGDQDISALRRLRAVG